MIELLAAAVEAEPASAGDTAPLWALVLVGMFSGVLGAVIGPIVQRTFSRSDRALDARQAWARDKLQTVFGVGDEFDGIEGNYRPFRRLVPRHPMIPHDYDMHTINWALQESTNLMMLQPVRSNWARDWLYAWHFRLQPEAKLLHRWRHQIDERFIWADGSATDTETGEGGLDYKRVQEFEAPWEAASLAYQRRVRRVQSSLSIWAIGQWMTRPSWWHWVFSRNLVQRIWRKNRATRTAPASVLSGNAGYQCECMARALEYEKAEMESLAEWEAAEAARKAAADGPN